MNIYLDENIASHALTGMLARLGHAAVQPSKVGLLEASDVGQLEYAIRNKLVVLTSDIDDFTELHQLILTATGSHAGILTVCFDNNLRHDMKPAQIALAADKVAKSGIDLTNQLVTLNQWR